MMTRIFTILMVSLVLSACGSSTPLTTAPQLTVAESMTRTDMTGFARADAPREFSFPADHGPHAGFAVEWWYFTGNLQAADGRQFGYQFTLFRSALQATPVAIDSQWATDAVFMAHLAVSDISGQRFFADERFNREALGLAGAQAMPWRVWLDDWQVFSADPDVGSMQIRAQNDDVALAFTLDSRMTPVLQGDAGLSQKSAGVGNASYYYSLTRMPTEGTLTIAGETVEVTGTSWMDREWSTSALDADQIGWDWFALHLDDGRDLMVYHLRRPDGSAHPYSGGSWRLPDGQVQRLTADDMQFTPSTIWQSPHTQARYPVQWQINLPTQGCTLDIAAQIPDQELQVTVRYWEGAVRVSGMCADTPVSGVGYLEMTGYADSARQ